MMRLCPKCGDYYADSSLAFCLGDGTPLVDVSPLGESWSAGERVIEGKENALRKRERRLKWRRILSAAVTVLIATLVVLVVAVNGFIYLRRQPATATATPTPTPVYKISGRVTDGGKALGGVKLTLGGAKSASTTTDASGNYAFSRLPAGGSYTVTPAGAKIDFTPPRRSVKNLTQDQSADFVGTLQPECSDADQSRERGIVINSCDGTWRRRIEADRSKILAEYLGVENAVAHLSAKIEYQITFSKECKAGVVTAKYTWQVTAPAIRTVPRPHEKRFTLVKTGDRWRCG